MEAERENSMKTNFEYDYLFAPDDVYEKYMKERGLVPLWRGEGTAERSGSRPLVEGEFETKPTKKSIYKKHYWFNAERVGKHAIRFECTCQRVKL
jgi:hypothetical protein